MQICDFLICMMQFCKKKDDILITHFLQLSATTIFQISTLLINDASLSLQSIYLTQMSLLMKWHKGNAHRKH